VPKPKKKGVYFLGKGKERYTFLRGVLPNSKKRLGKDLKRRGKKRGGKPLKFKCGGLLLELRDNYPKRESLFGRRRERGTILKILWVVKTRGQRGRYSFPGRGERKKQPKKGGDSINR